MVDGKATVVREDACDGMGNCIPACPQGAITFLKTGPAATPSLGIPMAGGGMAAKPTEAPGKNLGNWPLQIRLAPMKSPVYDNDLLISSDCAGFSDPDFQEKFLKGRTVLIGCPKLDPREWIGKLKEIFSKNDVKSITVVRMSVPCCGGLVSGVKEALAASGKDIPMEVKVVPTPLR